MREKKEKADPDQENSGFSQIWVCNLRDELSIAETIRQ